MPVAVPVVSEDRLLELVSCPQCGQMASVEWSRTVCGVVHLKIRCIARDWFLMTADEITYYGSQKLYLTAASTNPVAAESDRPGPTRHTTTPYEETAG